MTDQVEITQAAAEMANAQNTNAQKAETETVDSLKTQIAQLQAALKEVNRESAGRRKKLDELESAQKAQEEAKLSEMDKLKNRLAEYERQATDAAEEVARLKLRNVVESVAASLGFHNPADAYQLVDASAISIEGDKVTGVEDALKKLAQSSPYLVKSQPPASVPPSPQAKTQSSVPSGDIARKRGEYIGLI